MSRFQALALAALVLHALWLAWVALGWLITRRRPLLRWLHISSLLYGISIELFRWPCPLTLAEVEFARRAGQPTYREPFLVHYLERIIYPDLPEPVVTAAAVAVCVGILLVHVWRFGHKSSGGW